MMNSIGIRIVVAAACAASLSGCALLGIDQTRPASAAPAVEASPFETSGRYAASAGPTGLVRCKKASVNAQDCWRRGDAHVLYPDDSPGGVDLDTAAYATPVAVKASKKKK